MGRHATAIPIPATSRSCPTATRICRQRSKSTTSAEFLRAAPVGEAELTRNIIGVIGGMDTYQTPDAKGWTSMANWLIGATDELNQHRREEILSASPADFRKLADALAELARHGNVVVLGSEQAIAEANARREDVLQVTKLI